MLPYFIDKLIVLEYNESYMSFTLCPEDGSHVSVSESLRHLRFKIRI